MTIRETGIDQPRSAATENVQGVLDAAMNAEVTAEAIARAAGHESECRRGAHETGRDLVQGAVASDRDHQLAAVREGLHGQLRGMARVGGERDVGPLPGGKGLHAGDYAGGVAGVGIDDEAGLHAGRARPRAGRRASAERFFASRGDAKPSWVRTMKPKLHVLTGCTAVGKTEWALRWAEARGAEIVSCDSLLFYRGLDIGTAKPTAAERTRVPHHLVDICEVGERMDITHYVAKARAAVEEIQARGRPVLVVGGSGFYLKSFFSPVADEVAVPAPLREEVAQLSLEAALDRLRALNPAGLGALDTANPRRVSRALERCLRLRPDDGGSGGGICPAARAVCGVGGRADADRASAGGTGAADRGARQGDAARRAGGRGEAVRGGRLAGQPQRGAGDWLPGGDRIYRRPLAGVEARRGDCPEHARAGEEAAHLVPHPACRRTGKCRWRG